MTRLTAPLSLLALATVVGCGRTPEPRTEFACYIDFTGDCAELELIAERLTFEYRQEVEQENPSAQRADDIGQCSRRAVEQLQAMECFADRCEALCALHPCDVRADTPDCASACATEFGDTLQDTKRLEPIMLAAAERPGYCTCTICSGDAKVLCDETWVCPN
jgi:hypothetical protein